MFKKVILVTVLFISFATSVSASTLYEVKKGDSLTKIAKANKVTVNDLRSWNKLTKDNIYIKQKLIVSKPVAVKAATTTKQTVVTKPKPVTPIKTATTVAPPVQVMTPTNPISIEAKPLTVTGQAQYKMIVDFASRMQGIPYLFAGTTMAGFDCSGFIYFVHSQAGVKISRQSSEGFFAQSAAVSTPVAGDLVFFQNTYKPGISHMGIYLGDNKFIHAGSNGVEISSVDSVYWKEHFVSFNRFNAVTE